MHPLLPVAISCWLIFTEVSDAFQHSHLRTSLGPLNYIFPLGLMHQVHHSAEPKHRDRNFGNGSALFDWMFGTIYIPAPDEAILLGISEEEIGAQNPQAKVRPIFTSNPSAMPGACSGGAKQRWQPSRALRLYPPPGQAPPRPGPEAFQQNSRLTGFLFLQLTSGFQPVGHILRNDDDSPTNTD